MPMQTVINDFKPFFDANVAPGTPTIAPQLAEPVRSSTAGVIDLGGSGSTDSNFAKILFYATGTNGSTFNVELVGWQRCTVAGQTGLWVPLTIATLTCTLGTTLGPTSSTGPVLHTHAFVTTIVANNIVPNNNIWPAAHGIQLLAIDLAGVNLLQAFFSAGTGTVTDANGLISGY